MRHWMTHLAAGIALVAGAIVAAPTPALAQESVCTYYEDFSDGVANRLRGPTPPWRVRNEIYRLTPDTRQPSVFLSRFGPRLGAFDFRADVRLARGSRVSRRRGMGLVFFSDGTYDNCWVFHINARGKYIVFKRVNGVTKLITDGWQPYTMLERGIGAWNQLRVDYDDGSLAIWVNNDEGPLFERNVGTGKRGYVGLKGFGGRDGREAFQFDDLRIEDIDCWNQY